MDFESESNARNEATEAYERMADEMRTAGRTAAAKLSGELVLPDGARVVWDETSLIDK